MPVTNTSPSPRMFSSQVSVPAYEVLMIMKSSFPISCTYTLLHHRPPTTPRLQISSRQSSCNTWLSFKLTTNYFIPGLQAISSPPSPPRPPQKKGQVDVKKTPQILKGLDRAFNQTSNRERLNCYQRGDHRAPQGCHSFNGTQPMASH